MENPHYGIECAHSHARAHLFPTDVAIDFDHGLSLRVLAHPGAASGLRPEIDSVELDERIEALVSVITRH